VERSLKEEKEGGAGGEDVKVLRKFVEDAKKVIEDSK